MSSLTAKTGPRANTAPQKPVVARSSAQTARFIRNLQMSWAVLFPMDQQTQRRLEARLPQ